MSCRLDKYLKPLFIKLGNRSGRMNEWLKSGEKLLKEEMWNSRSISRKDVSYAQPLITARYGVFLCQRLKACA